MSLADLLSFYLGPEARHLDGPALEAGPRGREGDQVALQGHSARGQHLLGGAPADHVHEVTYEPLIAASVSGGLKWDADDLRVQLAVHVDLDLALLEGAPQLTQRAAGPDGP